MLKNLNSVKIIYFKSRKNKTGNLILFEKIKEIPFNMKNVFLINGEKNFTRGNHAHKKASQLLICISGKIEVTCQTSNKKKIYILKNSGKGLFIPVGIWSHHKYILKSSRLLVLSDKNYSESDYIRTFKNYLLFRKKNK